MEYHSHHVIKSWDYPKWIIDRHRKFFTFVHALVQVRFKDHYVDFHYAGYYPQTRERMSSKRRSAISSAQAQITKVQNVIMEYRDEKNKTLWNDLSKDEIYQKLLQKLEVKKFKLHQAIMMAVEEGV